MKKILVSLMALFAGFALFNMPISAAEEVPVEEPIVEEVDETITMTQEELDAYILELFEDFAADGYALVIGFWEAFTAVVGVSGIGAVIALAFWIMRKFGLFSKRMETNDNVIIQNAEATQKMAEEMVAFKKMFLAFIAIANVDPSIKAQMIDAISSNKTVDDFIKVARTTTQDISIKVNEEAQSLLTKLSERV